MSDRKSCRRYANQRGLKSRLRVSCGGRVSSHGESSVRAWSESGGRENRVDLIRGEEVSRIPI